MDTRVNTVIDKSLLRKLSEADEVQKKEAPIIRTNRKQVEKNLNRLTANKQVKIAMKLLADA